jgi:hypothetical protein
MMELYTLTQSDFRLGDSWKERIKNYPNTLAAKASTKFLADLMSSIRRRACSISKTGEEVNGSKTGKELKDLNSRTK